MSDLISDEEIETLEDGWETIHAVLKSERKNRYPDELHGDLGVRGEFADGLREQAELLNALAEAIDPEDEQEGDR